MNSLASETLYIVIYFINHR